MTTITHKQPRPYIPTQNELDFIAEVHRQAGYDAGNTVHSIVHRFVQGFGDLPDAKVAVIRELEKKFDVDLPC